MANIVQLLALNIQPCLAAHASSLTRWLLSFLLLLQALVSFSDFQIFQELIKGKEDDTYYKNCLSQILRLVAEEGCTTQKQVLSFLGQCFRVKLNLPEWHTSEQVGEFLLKYVLYLGVTCILSCCKHSCLVIM